MASSLAAISSYGSDSESSSDDGTNLHLKPVPGNPIKDMIVYSAPAVATKVCDPVFNCLLWCTCDFSWMLVGCQLGIYMMSQVKIKLPQVKIKQSMEETFKWINLIFITFFDVRKKFHQSNPSIHVRKSWISTLNMNSFLLPRYSVYFIFQILKFNRFVDSWLIFSRVTTSQSFQHDLIYTYSRYNVEGPSPTHIEFWAAPRRTAPFFALLTLIEFFFH